MPKVPAKQVKAKICVQKMILAYFFYFYVRSILKCLHLLTYLFATLAYFAKVALDVLLNRKLCCVN